MRGQNSKKIYKEDDITLIPKYKKIWYSATQFERYPQMASEGVGKAIGYLAWIMFLFSVILSIGMLIKFNNIIEKGIDYIESNFSEITYKDGILSVDPSIYEEKTRLGNLIINTAELAGEQEKEYEEHLSNANVNIILLKDKAIIKIGDTSIKKIYKEELEKIGLSEFDKAGLIKYIKNQINSTQMYIAYAVIITGYTFIIYFLRTLFEVLMLSIFGMLTTIISDIRIRYRAVFNMCIYSFTISIILQLIYLYIQLFTNFDVKYFDIMYTTISYICLVAAIFMIKSDVIKQKLQMIRVFEIKPNKEEKDEREEEPKDEKNDEENNEENKEKKKEEKNQNEGDALSGDSTG